MRVREFALVQRLHDGLKQCEIGPVPLPGVQCLTKREAFIGQLVDSIRRVKFVPTMAARNIHPDRGNGLSSMFDPVKGAVSCMRVGDVDEACWLIFIFIHFGKHAKSGYRYAREVYGALGTRAPWTFASTSADVAGFRTWLDAHQEELCRGAQRGFGNHRKYQSLAAYKPNGTGDAFSTYVQWVRGGGDHATLIHTAMQQANMSPPLAFDLLYKSMATVSSFGRTARFDYLTMLGKLGIADIRPGSAYFAAATGPVVGARLMLQGNTSKDLSVRELDKRVAIMAELLGVGMQEMEDSLCNWQKSPDNYVRFLT
jgi:Alpha-glutamyl/putrescinyl thymine pyrophosphorylase clade 3